LAVDNFKKLFPKIAYVGVAEVMRCDAVIIVTEWEEFNNLDYRGKVVIDGRRVLKAREARIYEGVCW
jgi:UDPglucose 6-dehydrogenase